MGFIVTKAILFDLDGTLLDRPTSLEKFLRNQYSRFSFNVPFEIFQERFLQLDQNGYVWKDRVYQQLEEEWSLPSNQWQELLEDYVQNFSKECVAFSYSHQLLSSLSTQGYKLGLITNGYTDFQLRNIRSLKLDSYFDTILVSEREGMKKPDRRLFQKALDQLEVRADQSFFIGDHEDKDIHGAQDCGMETVLIDHHRTTVNSAAHYIAYSCEDLQLLFSGNTVQGE